jgi:hypothetical protein
MTARRVLSNARIDSAPHASVCWALVIVLTAALGLAWTARASAQQTSTHSFLKANLVDPNIWDDETMREINKVLGNSYANLQVVVSACASRGFAERAVGRLQGHFSVAASRDYSKTEGYLVTLSKKYGEVRRGDRHVEGLRTGTESETRAYRYVHGWLGAWIKAMRANADTTAQGLFDAAKQNDYNLSRHTNDGPKFVSGGNGNQATVGDGAMGRNALIWDAFSGGGEESVSLYTGLEARGYNPGNAYDPSTIDLAYSNADRIDATGDRNPALRHPDAASGEGPSVPVHFQPTKDSLFGQNKMLARLRSGLDANANNRKALIVIGSHGGSEKRKDEKVGALPGERDQGRVITSGATTILDLDAAFLDLFFTGTGVDDDPVQARVSTAAVFFTTSEESGSETVQVFLELPLDPPVLLGATVLNGDSAGHTYEIPIDDAVMRDLFENDRLAGLTAELRFELGTAAFRLATEWDFELDELDHYGVGLATPAVSVAQPIPMPGVSSSVRIVIVALILGVLARRCRLAA